MSESKTIAVESRSACPDPDRVLELHKMRVNAIVTDNVPMAMDVLYGLNGE